jgi:KUP system potassium uptake protein
VLSENVVILSIDTQPVPHVPSAERLVTDDLGYTDDGIMHATARFGYLDVPNVPSVLREVAESEVESAIDVWEASYFLSTIDLCLSDRPGMSRWRKRLFLATARISTDAADYFRLPRERTVVMGSRIEV